MIYKNTLLFTTHSDFSAFNCDLSGRLYTGAPLSGSWTTWAQREYFAWRMTTIYASQQQQYRLTFTMIIIGSSCSCQFIVLHFSAVSMLMYLYCHFTFRSPPSYTVSLIGFLTHPTVLQQVQRISNRLRWTYSSTVGSYNGNSEI